MCQSNRGSETAGAGEIPSSPSDKSTLPTGPNQTDVSFVGMVRSFPVPPLAEPRGCATGRGTRPPGSYPTNRTRFSGPGVDDLHGEVEVGNQRAAFRCVIAYSVGSTRSVRIVDEMIPPTTTVASGR